MTTLTVNSLSLTPRETWPTGTEGILVGRDGGPYFAPDGDTLPTSTQAGTWSGTPAVQTDFSPE